LKEVEFRVPKHSGLRAAEAMIESVCAQRGLTIGRKGSLASFPGSIHWHFKTQKERGTLEITLWPNGRRLWAQVQKGRRAAWIDRELPVLRQAIEKQLAGIG
jgi:hypothetical protein